VLSGVVPEPMALLDAISEAGATVAADDTLCCGHRLYPSGDSEEPYERLAQRLLGAPPCSTRGSPIQQRIDHLLGLVERTGARGVLFHEVKFCEPEQFYLPYVREALDEAGIRSVVIEVDLSDPLPHQAITRLEALVETVR